MSKIKTFLGWCVVFLICALIRFLRLTYRIKLDDKAGLLDVARKDETVQYVFASWHNRLAFQGPLFPRFIRRRVVALTSLSKDGRYAAWFASIFRMKVVRGSSSRGGMKAVKSILRYTRQNFHVAVTPDGPRGPRYKPQAGVIFISKACKVPLVPISVNAESRWQLGGWDKLQIPKPFSKVTVVVGEPLHVTEKLTDEQMKIEQERLEKAMLAITKD